MMKLMKIFEYLWLAVAVLSVIIAITRASQGQNWGNYIYIAIFTASIAVFMYFFKKRNRIYMEKMQERKDGKSE